VNAPVLHRRRIERYAQLLDEASGARRHHARSPIDDELANMLAVKTTLATASPDLEPTETYRMEGRAQIMAAAERLGVGRTYREPADELAVSRPAVGRASVGTVHESASRRLLPGRRGSSKPRLSANRSRTRGAILVGLAVGTLALSGISAASGDAMPGSALYGMKRAAENAQISLAGSDVAKGKFYLQDARTRVIEAQQVSGDSVTLAGVLATMNDESDAGARLMFADAVRHRSASDLATIDAFVTYQQKQLDNLRTAVHGSVAESTLVSEAKNNLQKIALRSSDIADKLQCANDLKSNGGDEVGPFVECHANASGAITGPSVYRAGGSVAGTVTKSAERTAPAAVKSVTSPAGTTPSPAASQASPDPAQSDDGGLLGAVEHLLGGL
jgi:hypothetical protein